MVSRQLSSIWLMPVESIGWIIKVWKLAATVVLKSGSKWCLSGERSLHAFSLPAATDNNRYIYCGSLTPTICPERKVGHCFAAAQAAPFIMETKFFLTGNILKVLLPQANVNTISFLVGYYLHSVCKYFFSIRITNTHCGVSTAALMIPFKTIC